MRYVYETTEFLDERCYTTYAMTPEILMEHAGLALAKAVKKRLSGNKRALFLCGSGNNGADGMVAARLLHGTYDVALYCPLTLKSPLANINFERARLLGIPIVHELIDADVYVDALFGAGLNRLLDPQLCDLLSRINAHKGYKIACDIPSGLLCDLRLSSCVFKADETICMGALKLSLLNDMSKDFVGKIRIASLGIDRSLYSVPSSYHVLQKKDLRLPYRTHKNSNKGTYGHVCIVQGNKEGAARLAGMGAFHFGAGLVTLLGDSSAKVPAYLMRSSTLPRNASVIVAGMGLEMPFDEAFIGNLLNSSLPCVLDASLCHHPLIKDAISKQKPLVLTPHPKEFASILNRTHQMDVSVEEIQANRFYYAKRFCQTFPHVTLVLKGANTIIAQHEELFINPFGEPALAKGGSGDVLAGMIGALIAQNYTPKEAAIQASLAHALVSKKIKCNNFALTPIDICKGLKWL